MLERESTFVRCILHNAIMLYLCVLGAHRAENARLANRRLSFRCSHYPPTKVITADVSDRPTQIGVKDRVGTSSMPSVHWTGWFQESCLSHQWHSSMTIVSTVDAAIETKLWVSTGVSSSDSDRNEEIDPYSPVLEIDVGMDESEESEDFHTPYWKTRR